MQRAFSPRPWGRAALRMVHSWLRFFLPRSSPTAFEISFAARVNHDPLKDALTRVLVEKTEATASLTVDEQEQVNVELQATLGPKIERILEERRLAFENASKVTLN
jgi:hypothetical protein